MKTAVFSTRKYTQASFEKANENFGHDLSFFDWPLNRDLIDSAKGYSAICIFVNDRCNQEVLRGLTENGVNYIVLRCAGFNNVDLHAARELGIRVARVPYYSPHAVAEHTVALMLALNRKIHRAFNRVREANFELEGLLGFDMQGRTVGIVGTGKIGFCVAKILHGFGCKLLGYDVHPNRECESLGMDYVGLSELYRRSDIITLHCPLTKATKHLIGKKAIAKMKDGVMLINTSRGALVDSLATVESLKEGKIGYLGLDVYEEEESLFFSDLSSEILRDDVFARLLTFPNVIITGHQAFFSDTALAEIAKTTLKNLADFERNGKSENEIPLD